MILVCGDAMLDRYWFGDVARISPEAPVPVVRMRREEERPGAAANVARNIEAMGGACRAMYGDGERIVKLRVIGRSQQMVRVDFDHPQQPITDIPKAEIVVFSDYGKGSLANIQDLIKQAKSSGAIVLVDPKGYDYERYAGADVVKPNLDEMKAMVGGWKDEADLERKAQKLREQAGIGAILLTRAAEGMTLYTESGAIDIPSVAKEVYDVSGAGDTAIAALAVALSRGCELHEAAGYANKAAGIAVGRFGTSVATREEVFGA